MARQTGADNRFVIAEKITRYEDFLRSVSDWAWESDRRRRYVFVTAGAARAFGVPSRDLVGSSIVGPRFFDPADAEVIGVDKALRSRRPFRDKRLRCEDAQGTQRVISLSGVPVFRSASGKFEGYRGVGIDLTPFLGAKRKSDVASHHGAQASRTEVDRVTEMSHEMRTPLNAIIGFAEVMVEETFGPLGSERYREYAEDIHESGQHLLDIVNRTLELAKLETGHAEISEEEIDVVDTMEACLRLVRKQAEKAGVQISLHPQWSVARLRADKVKVKQILLNLLSNALKHTKPGGTVRIGARVEQAGTLRIEVEDTGLGISSKDLPKVFQPFGQVQGPKAGAYEGTGLGLWISNSLAEIHGGSLKLISREGIGTTAIVEFPADRVVQIRRELDPLRILF